MWSRWKISKTRSKYPLLDPDPVVRDGETPPPAIGFGRAPDLERTVGMAVFERVADKVRNDLGEPGPGGHDRLLRAAACQSRPGAAASLKICRFSSFGKRSKWFRPVSAIRSGRTRARTPR